MAKPYTLKKSLGQHFLHDEQICKKIVDSLTKKSGMNLLEVGPGGGAITKYLIDIEDITYKAVEVDEEKVLYLENTYEKLKGKITQQDILKADVPYDDNFTLIGNFPYNISSQILFKVLDWEEEVDEVIGMFQKEVALRIASDSGSKQYGILSVLIGAFFKVDYLFDVEEHAFTPAPKVKSGVIRLTNLNNPHGITDKRKFKVLVKTAFNQRRKMLRNGLAGILPKEVLDTHPFMTKRAEQLSIEDFVSLYKAYFS